MGSGTSDDSLTISERSDTGGLSSPGSEPAPDAFSYEGVLMPYELLTGCPEIGGRDTSSSRRILYEAFGERPTS
jgi:hypothetical protein